MGKVIEFKQQKQKAQIKKEKKEPVSIIDPTMPLTEEQMRSINLIRTLLYEAIGAAVSIVDQEFLFEDFIYDSRYFDTYLVENGGYMTAAEVTAAYSLVELLAPMVNKFVLDLKDLF